MLNYFDDIIVDEFPSALPPIISLIRHIDRIPGEIFPNKVAHRLTPQDNAKIGIKVQELMENGLIR